MEKILDCKGMACPLPVVNTKKATEEVVNTLFDTISETLETGEKVVISGFGTFEIRTRVARTGRPHEGGPHLGLSGGRRILHTMG